MSDRVLTTHTPCWCCGGTDQIHLDEGDVYCYDCMAAPQEQP